MIIPWFSSHSHLILEMHVLHYLWMTIEVDWDESKVNWKSCCSPWNSACLLVLEESTQVSGVTRERHSDPKYPSNVLPIQSWERYWFLILWYMVSYLVCHHRSFQWEFKCSLQTLISLLFDHNSNYDTHSYWVRTLVKKLLFCTFPPKDKSWRGRNKWGHREVSLTLSQYKKSHDYFHHSCHWKVSCCKQTSCPHNHFRMLY